MAASNALNTTRSDLVRETFEKFASIIRPADDRLFRDTRLEDVWTAARIIERDQHQRNCQRHLRRIEPLLDALRKFGIAIEPLCQGVPYLCYIWAPIKLLLQIADEYTKGFEQLLDAYAQIAQHMPRFDRLSSAFQNEPDFQAVLTDVYSDILEFHSHAYRFLRRSGWKHLFDSSWKSFGGRFNAILQRLARGRDLIDKEASSLDILQGKAFRQTLLAEVERQETFRTDWRIRDCIAWLDLKGQELDQEELLERRIATRAPNTCRWLLNNAKILTWLDEDDPRQFLWLRGKPGSGKTTLACYLIQEASFPPKSTIIYCLCTYEFSKIEKNACNLAFRSILAQLIRSKPDVADYIYDTCVKSASLPSGFKVRQAIKDILGAVESMFLVVDGLDECEPTHQRQFLSELQQLLEPDIRVLDKSQTIKLKILVCSRESKEIMQKLRGKPILSLNEEKKNLSQDISLTTKNSLQDLKFRFGETAVDEVVNEVVERSDGMFLWVHLVIGTLLDQQSEYDLRQTLKRLPSKLPDVYRSILRRIDHEADSQKIRRINIILSCIAFATRPLRSWEICDFIVLHEQDSGVNEQTQLGVGALDMCKPLIEEQEGHMIGLVHFSAREFLIHEFSGPRLVESRAQRQLTTACIRYLLTCKHFPEAEMSPRGYGDIIRGFDNLFPYVYENWHEHLQRYCMTFDPSASGMLLHQDVESLLSKLALKFARSTNQEGGSNKSSSAVGAFLTSIPTVFQDYIAYWQGANKIQQFAGRDDLRARTDATNDPTSISATYRCFQKAFESLLDASLPFTPHVMGVEDDQLNEFRSRHQSSLFLCRYNGCSRASRGFSSDLRRVKHEDLHKPQYRCEDPACVGADGVFATKESLRRHIKRYHPNDTALETLPPFPTKAEKSTPSDSLERHDSSSSFSEPPVSVGDTRTVNQQHDADSAGLSATGEVPVRHALQDYQMQLMLLEQQHKKRIIMMTEILKRPNEPLLPLTDAAWESVRVYYKGEFVYNSFINIIFASYEYYVVLHGSRPQLKVAKYFRIDPKGTFMLSSSENLLSHTDGYSIGFDSQDHAVKVSAHVAELELGYDNLRA